MKPLVYNLDKMDRTIIFPGCTFQLEVRAAPHVAKALLAELAIRSLKATLAQLEAIAAEQTVTLCPQCLAAAVSCEYCGGYGCLTKAELHARTSSN
jgi:hypothetical protein